jgi:hypothetical protein
MTMDIHLYHHISPSPPDPRLDQVLALLQQLTRTETSIMASLADITTAVAAEKTVEDSVMTLLGEIGTHLKAAIASNDPVAMQAVVDQITANTAALSAAVVANTPAAP